MPFLLRGTRTLLVAITALLVALVSACGTSEPATSEMPDMVGMNLEKAQDEAEDIGLKVTTTDATTQGRSVWSASNWTVRAQDIEAGNTISKGDRVVFEVDKKSDSAGDSSGSSDTAGVKNGSGEAGSSETGDGVDFSGKGKKDTAANAGATVDKKGVEVTSEPLREVSQQYGGPLLCTSVTIVNNTDKQERFNGYFDWMLQDPNGVAKDATFSMDIDTLESGQLAPGGRTQGDVCFDNPGAPGEYVVLMETTFSFDSSRIGWVNTL